MSNDTVTDLQLKRLRAKYESNGASTDEANTQASQDVSQQEAQQEQSGWDKYATFWSYPTQFIWDAYKGMASPIEGISDWVESGVSKIAQDTGNQELSDKINENIAWSWSDAWLNSNWWKWVNTIANPTWWLFGGNTAIEKAQNREVLPEVASDIAEGVGQSVMYMGLSSVAGEAGAAAGEKVASGLGLANAGVTAEGVSTAANIGSHIASDTAMFASASGNTIADTLSSGEDLDTALKYGALSGATEVLTEEVTDKLVNGLLKATHLDTAIGKVSQYGVGGSLGTSRLANILTEAGEEGLEEVLGDVIDPISKMLTTDDDKEGNFFQKYQQIFEENGGWENVVKDFLMAAASTGILQGAKYVGSDFANGRTATNLEIYSQKMSEIDEEIKKAEKNGNKEKIDALNAQKDNLKKSIKDGMKKFVEEKLALGEKVDNYVEERERLEEINRQLETETDETKKKTLEGTRDGILANLSQSEVNGINSKTLRQINVARTYDYYANKYNASMEAALETPGDLGLKHTNVEQNYKNLNSSADTGTNTITYGNASINEVVSTSPTETVINTQKSGKAFVKKILHEVFHIAAKGKNGRTIIDTVLDPNNYDPKEYDAAYNKTAEKYKNTYNVDYIQEYHADDYNALIEEYKNSTKEDGSSYSDEEASSEAVKQLSKELIREEVAANRFGEMFGSLTEAKRAIKSANFRSLFELQQLMDSKRRAWAKSAKPANYYEIMHLVKEGIKESEAQAKEQINAKYDAVLKSNVKFSIEDAEPNKQLLFKEEDGKLYVRRSIDSLVYNELKPGDVISLDYYHQSRNRIIGKKKHYINALTTGGGHYAYVDANGELQLLTPKDTWKLQGFTNEDYDKLVKKGFTNSAVFGATGNSMTKQVMQSVLGNLNLPKNVKIIEYFGGIGAPRMALRDLGYNVTTLDYREINNNSRKIYNTIFNENMKSKGVELPNDVKEIADILIHGSPCVDFSNEKGKMAKGAKKGSGSESSLMWETVSRLYEMKEKNILPRVVVWENVANVQTEKYSEEFNMYLDEMKSLGYTNSYDVLNSINFGVPQTRSRSFVVSILDGSTYTFNKGDASLQPDFLKFIDSSKNVNNYNPKSKSNVKYSLVSDEDIDKYIEEFEKTINDEDIDKYVEEYENTSSEDFQKTIDENSSRIKESLEKERKERLSKVTRKYKGEKLYHDESYLSRTVSIKGRDGKPIYSGDLSYLNGSYKVKTVDIDKLLKDTNIINNEGVLHRRASVWGSKIEDYKFDSLKEALTNSPILIGIDNNGKYYIKDGNHRLIALYNEGFKYADLLVSDNSNVKYSLAEDENGNLIEGNIIKDSDGNTLFKNQREYFKDSKVVDDEGNLVVLYHGTKNNFTVFDKSKIGSTGRYEGAGFNYTPSESRANGYGSGKIFKGYVNIEHPLSNTKTTFTISSLSKLLQEIDPTGDNIIGNYAENFNDYGSNSFIVRESRNAARKLLDYHKNDVDLYCELSTISPDSETLINKFSDMGYDGLIHYYDDGKIKTVVTFNSNQFKNVDNTSPTTNPDIRYSLAEDEEGNLINEAQQNSFRKEQGKNVSYEKQYKDILSIKNTGNYDVDKIITYIDNRMKNVSVKDESIYKIAVDYYNKIYNAVKEGNNSDSKLKYDFKDAINEQIKNVMEAQEKAQEEAKLKAEASAEEVNTEFAPEDNDIAKTHKEDIDYMADLVSKFNKRQEIEYEGSKKTIKLKDMNYNIIVKKSASVNTLNIYIDQMTKFISDYKAKADLIDADAKKQNVDTSMWGYAKRLETYEKNLKTAKEMLSSKEKEVKPEVLRADNKKVESETKENLAKEDKTISVSAKRVTNVATSSLTDEEQVELKKMQSDHNELVSNEEDAILEDGSTITDYEEQADTLDEMIDSAKESNDLTDDDKKAIAKLEEEQKELRKQIKELSNRVNERNDRLELYKSRYENSLKLWKKTRYNDVVNKNKEYREDLRKLNVVLNNYAKELNNYTEEAIDLRGKYGSAEQINKWLQEDYEELNKKLNKVTSKYETKIDTLNVKYQEAYDKVTDARYEKKTGHHFDVSLSSTFRNIAGELSNMASYKAMISYSLGNQLASMLADDTFTGDDVADYFLDCVSSIVINENTGLTFGDMSESLDEKEHAKYDRYRNYLVETFNQIKDGKTLTKEAFLQEEINYLLKKYNNVQIENQGINRLRNSIKAFRNSMKRNIDSDKFGSVNTLLNERYGNTFTSSVIRLYRELGNVTLKNTKLDNKPLRASHTKVGEPILTKENIKENLATLYNDYLQERQALIDDKTKYNAIEMDANVESTIKALINTQGEDLTDAEYDKVVETLRYLKSYIKANKGIANFVTSDVAKLIKKTNTRLEQPNSNSNIKIAIADFYDSYLYEVDHNEKLKGFEMDVDAERTIQSLVATKNEAISTDEYDKVVKSIKYLNKYITGLCGTGMYYLNGKVATMNTFVARAIKEQKDIGKKRKWRAIYSFVTPKTVFEMMSHQNENSIFMDVYNELHNGQRKMMESYMDMYNHADEKKNVIGYYTFCNTLEGKKLMRELANKKDNAKVEITVGDKTVSARTSQYLSFYELYKREKAKIKLEKGGFSVVQFENIHFDTIDDVAAFVDEIAKHYDLENEDSVYAKYLRETDNLFEIARRIKVETDVLTRGFTNIEEGFYFPMKIAEMELNKDFFTLDSGNTSDMQGAKNFSFNMDTVDNTHPLDIGDIEHIIQNYSRQLSIYAGYAPVLTTFAKLYNTRISEKGNFRTALMQSFEDTSRKKVENYLDQLFKDVQGIKTQKDNTSSTIDYIAGKIRSHSAAVALFGNLKVYFSQVSSYPAAMKYINYKNLARGLKIRGRKDIPDLPATAIYRNIEKSVIKAETRSETLGNSTNLFGKPISYFDSITIKAIWRASCYQEKVMDYEVGSEKYLEALERAQELFNNTVDETQPNYNALGRSEVMRSNSEIIRLFTMFKTQGSQNFSNLMEFISKVRYGKADKKDLGMLVGLLLQGIMYTFIGEIFKKLKKNDWDVTSGEWWADAGKDYGVDFVNDTILSMLPILDNFELDLSENFNFSVSGSSIKYSSPIKFNELDAGWLSSVLDAVNGLLDGKVTPKEVVNLFSYGTGIPATNIMTYFEALMKYINPESEYVIDSWYKSSDTTSKSSINTAMETSDVMGEAAYKVYTKNSVTLTSSTFDKLYSLYRDGNHDVAIKQIPDTIYYNENTYTVDKTAFRKIYSEVAKPLDKMTSSYAFNKLTKENQVKTVKYIMDLYYSIAKKSVTGQELSFVENLLANGYNLTPKQILLLIELTSMEKDENSTKKEKISSYINSLDTYKAEKYFYYMLAGYTPNDDNKNQVRKYLINNGVNYYKAKAYVGL